MPGSNGLEREVFCAQLHILRPCPTLFDKAINHDRLSLAHCPQGLRHCPKLFGHHCHTLDGKEYSSPLEHLKLALFACNFV